MSDELFNDLTEEERDELERRWRAFQEDPNEGRPWEEVKRELLHEIEWAHEIERRARAVDSGEVTTSDWEVVRERIEHEIFKR